jgi:hypothetical protein
MAGTMEADAMAKIIFLTPLEYTRHRDARPMQRIKETDKSTLLAN